MGIGGGKEHGSGEAHNPTRALAPGVDPPRRAAWLAWALCGVSLALLGLILAVVLLGWSSASPEGFTPWEGQAIYAVGLIGTPVLGVIIILRLPRS
jgi:hypothetical protein